MSLTIPNISSSVSIFYLFILTIFYFMIFCLLNSLSVPFFLYFIFCFQPQFLFFLFHDPFFFFFLPRNIFLPSTCFVHFIFILLPTLYICFSLSSSLSFIFFIYFFFLRFILFFLYPNLILNFILNYFLFYFFWLFYFSPLFFCLWLILS